MNAHCCVVVADHSRARVFVVDTDGGRQRLVEQADVVNEADDAGAGPVSPVAGARPSHRLRTGAGTQCRLSLEQRYARALATRAAGVVDRWEDGEVMLVAPAHMLGQLRQVVRACLPRRCALKQLAREYMNLTASELGRELGLNARQPGRARLE